MGCGSSKNYNSDEENSPRSSDELNCNEHDGSQWASRKVRTTEHAADSEDGLLTQHQMEMKRGLSLLPRPSPIFNDILFLGPVTVAAKKEQLEALGITHILSVAPITPKFPKDFEYKTVPIEDDETENILQYFDACFAFLDEALEGGGKVFVHCKMGVSRSATICIAYVLREQPHLDVDGAIRHCQERRPCIKPNSGFQTQLRLFHDMGCKIYPDHRMYKALAAQLQRMREHRDHVAKLSEMPAYNVFRDVDQMCAELYERLELVGVPAEEPNRIYDISAVRGLSGLTPRRLKRTKSMGGQSMDLNSIDDMLDEILAL